jgi:hypothetical protein
MTALSAMIEAVGETAIPAASRPYFLAAMRDLLTWMGRGEAWTPRLAALLDEDARRPAAELWASWMFAVARGDRAACTQLAAELEALGAFQDARVSLEGIAVLFDTLHYMQLRRAH